MGAIPKYAKREQAQQQKDSNKMEIAQKQAMHVEPGKSFGTAEANENERRWDNKKIDAKNQVPTNHYDKTRMHLNFEIGEDRKLHPLGYHKQNLDKRLEKRLTKLGWHPFKESSKIQPNCCAKFIFGGDHDRTLEMAFGDQKVNSEKDTDNSNLHRCKEIEQWALDIYSWCAKRFGQENIIGFQVHLDETSPHIHALIVPVGERGKDKHPCVMWSAKFGKNIYEYGQILREMHTSLYENVGSKYGLERGDSVRGRDVKHLNKTEYIRKLNKEIQTKNKAIKGLETMIKNLTNRRLELERESEKLIRDISYKKMNAQEAERRKTMIQNEIEEIKSNLEDKKSKLINTEKDLSIKQQELESLASDVKKAYSIRKPFENISSSYTIPKITSKPPKFGVDNWIKNQNSMIKDAFSEAIHKMANIYQSEAQKQVKEAQENIIYDYSELHLLRAENKRLTSENQELDNQLFNLLEQMTIPDLRKAAFVIASQLIVDDSPNPGGGDSSDMRWDGRRPGEDDDSYARRCLLYASQQVSKRKKNGLHR